MFMLSDFDIAVLTKSLVRLKIEAKKYFKFSLLANFLNIDPRKVRHGSY